MVNIVFECHNCKVSQKENPINVKSENIVFNGQPIDLKYYDCPVCRARNYVQADDNLTRKILSDCKKQIHNQIVLNGKGQKGKLLGKAKKKQIHLGRARKTLQNMLIANKKIHFVTYKIVGDNDVKSKYDM